MKLRLSMVAVFALIVVAAAPAQNNTKLGQLLVDKFFNAVIKKDRRTLNTLLAPGFQSAHDDGARTRAQELNLLANLNLKRYRISRLVATRSGTSLVVTYMLQAAETINARELSAAVPAPRLTVFNHVRGQWKIVAHANLRPL
jgi:hypothetical protein